MNRPTVGTRDMDRLTKPFSAMDLLNQMRRMLDRPAVS